MTAKKLRQKYPKFIYHQYTYYFKQQQLQIEFKFSTPPDHQFTAQLNILNCPQLEQFDRVALDTLIFNLGLAEIPSYWKTTCSPEIEIQAGRLNQNQLAWWHDLFLKGMGEYYYQNRLDFTQPHFLTLTASSSRPNFKAKKSTKLMKKQQQPKKYLVPVGGGKDSGLDLGLLDKHQIDYGCLLLEPQSPAAQQIVDLSQNQATIRLQRKIDPYLLKLNQQSYLNGHVPFSAYLSFASLVAAHLFNYQNIVMANERSANQANLTYLDQAINHQYSKSYEYEQKFNQYIKQDPYLPSIKYLSLLRPLHELQIAQLFSQFTQYFPVFKSCNQGQQQGVWCEQCAKCLFVFIILSPFIDLQTLSSTIFSKNLYQDLALLPLAEQLAGLTQFKPFECVGTYLETAAALHLMIKKAASLPLLEKIKAKLYQKYQPAQLAQASQKLLADWSNQHQLNPKLINILKQELS